MIHLKTFCYFWDTRMGCIVIGYLTGALSILCCVGSVLRLFLGFPLILQNDDFQGEFPFNPLFFVFSAMFFGFHSVTSFSLVPATKEGQGMFVVPTLVMLFIDVILDCTAIIVLGMMLIQHNQDEFILVGIILTSFLLPLLIYATVIVISQFEELFQKSDRVPLQRSNMQKSMPTSDTSVSTVV
ncbi:hypothetical protein JTE90_011311 [Oedothorax gibbosus]|uniref:Uncharacterized protein n=1 Tax=Oedothorax gibbosus TaxID=931172 RepID=A0AAV6VM48_9ARAC|nr:hypothetical protein JTE90_011311 [Oedothorax gibbosus]